MNNPQQTFLAPVHGLRGLAIIAIVAAHTWAFLIFWSGSLDSAGLRWLYALTETLFHGSTLYFALISGLLFSSVLKSRGWRRFFVNKLRYLLLPYALVSALCTWSYWQQTLAQNPAADPLQVYGGNLLAGSASVQFWYIPLLCGLFLLTPLLVWLHRRWSGGLLVLALVPLVVSRSAFPDLLTWQSLVYFLGAYSLGLWCGEHYLVLLDYLRRNWRWMALVLVVLSLATGLSYYLGHQGEGLFFYRQSLVYLQKILLAGLMLLWLSQHQRIPTGLKLLGDYAFAIYFLHVLVLDRFYFWIYDWLVVHRTGAIIGGLGALNLLWTLGVSLLLAWLVKKVLGRYARPVIGA